VVVLKGTVTEWKWSNPHVWIYLSVDDDKGGKVDWAIEGRDAGPIGPRRLVEEAASSLATSSPSTSARPRTAATPASSRASGSLTARCWVRHRRPSSRGSGGHRVEVHRSAFRAAHVRAPGNQRHRFARRRSIRISRVCITRSTRSATSRADARGSSAARRGAPAGAVPPPRPVLVLDGREGRPENAPKLKPEYLAKWEVIRKSRMAGSDEYDPNARCVSAGMPNMMSMTYGMEIQQTKIGSPSTAS
jgi:hypothetical protein